MALVMTMSLTAVRTARRNLVQRIGRFVKRIQPEEQRLRSVNRMAVKCRLEVLSCRAHQCRQLCRGQAIR